MSKIICFDFDDVIVNNRMLQKLPFIGSRFKRIELGMEYMEGSLEPKKFAIFARNLANELKGVNVETIAKYVSRARLHKGVREVFEHLSSNGYKIVIISTNDITLIKHFLEKHKLLQHVSHIYASEFELKDGIITGKIKGNIIETEKLAVLQELRKKYNLTPSQIVYIGDGLTDLPLMKKIGKGILFNPNTFTKVELFADKILRKKIQEKKIIILEEKDLRKVLEFI